MYTRLPILAVCGLLTLSAPAAAGEIQPNVLFIAVDDLVTRIGPYGDQQAITPAMDKLAGLGTTFLTHQCQWPVCGPSRAALTTSLMPEETGVMGFKPIRAILPDVITLPQHFRNNGYETAATGKFHDPRTVGTITDPNSSTTDGRVTDDIPSWSIPYVSGDSGYSPAGNPAVDNSNRPDSDYTDYNILVQGKTFLNQLSAGSKPFFLAVGFKKPHLPFVAPKQYWDKYNRDQFSVASYTGLPVGSSTYVDASLTDNAELLGYEPYSASGLPTPAQQKELIHGYYACVTFIDTLVGDLMAHLATLNDPLQTGRKLSETTIVVLWGDHGFHLGDHGKWAKHSNMEQAARAPLIIYDPRDPANGVKTQAPANSMDIYPTLCELAGLPLPEQPLSATVTTGRPLKGRSLVPALHDDRARIHTGAITHFSKSGGYGYAYRTDRYRYIEWVNSSNVVKARELYDYLLDPLETRNVISDDGYAAVAYQLSRAMRADSSTSGAVRLQSSSPIPASGAEISLGDGYLHGLAIALDPSNSAAPLRLTWPGVDGVDYDLMTSSTLAPESWAPAVSGIGGTAVSVQLNEQQQFFRIRISATQVMAISATSPNSPNP